MQPPARSATKIAPAVPFCYLGPALRSGEHAMPRIHRGVAAGAALVMAYHLAARAVRDALFLSRLEARELPLMMAAAAVVGMAAALSATAWTARHGSRRFVPAAFVLSALLTLLEWALIAARPPWGAVAFFLHVAAFGPVLVSGLWSTMLDTLDPRTMRAMLGRIAAIATVGGLAGLVVANALGTWFGITAVLPALAALNLACAVIRSEE